jgi:hypothetical protein
VTAWRRAAVLAIGLYAGFMALHVALAWDGGRLVKAMLPGVDVWLGPVDWAIYAAFAIGAAVAVKAVTGTGQRPTAGWARLTLPLLAAGSPFLLFGYNLAAGSVVPLLVVGVPLVALNEDCYSEACSLICSSHMACGGQSCGPGSIDPGIVFHRLRDGQPAEAIESDLDRRSGLVGVAGSADMGQLLARDAGGDERARLAVEMFVRRAAAAIAASATNLATIDALVFTGGIGEHATSVRTRICERLHLVRLDGREQDIQSDGWLGTTSGPSVLRVTSLEDLVIAAQVVAVVGGS